MAYLRISTPQSDELIKWVAGADSTITEEDVDISYPNNKQDVWKFAHNLYSIFLSCTEDDTFRICHSVNEGNGLEAMRLLMKRYEPRTPGTKRALLKAIINNPASNKPDELEKNLMKVEEYMKHYEVMAGADLPEDLKVTVIIDLCTKDLKEHLELSTREMTYKQVRDEIISYAERKRNAFSNDLKSHGRGRGGGRPCVDGSAWSTTTSSGTSTAPRNSSTAWAGTRVLARAATRAGPRAVPRATRRGILKAVSTVTTKESARATTAREDPRVTAKEKVARAAASTGIATGAESGDTLNRVVARRTSTWRTSGRTGRAAPRAATSTVQTASKTTRTSWNTWKERADTVASVPWFAALQELDEDEQMANDLVTLQD